MQSITTVVNAGRLLDGRGGVLDDATMVIRDGVIVGVGPRGTVDEPRDARVIAADGFTVMPGIIDCHTHLGGASSADYSTWVIEDDLRQAVLSTTQMRDLMDWGVTTIRDISRNGIRLKWAVNNGHLDGPRIIACGPGLSRTGGHGDAHNLSIDMVQRSHPWGMIADGPEELRKAVRTLSRMGADAIKVWATGGGMWDKELETDQHYDLEELTAIVREADHLKIPVLVHAESMPAAKDSIRAGIATLEHGEELDDECRSMMLEKGIIHVPTLQLFIGPWFDQYPPPPRVGLEDWPGETMAQKEKNRVIANFTASREAGITIAVGSDSFSSIEVPYGASTIEEIHAMVRVGMPALEAITAATWNGARALRIDGVTGTLQEGFASDFLIIDGDPLADITHLTRDRMVHIQRGTQVWHDELSPKPAYARRNDTGRTAGSVQ
ncbi:amidohydrolase family protein [uncultured Microbacterium sp.]|uniref:amidohydrolase family protein n=1 Tax=uncultured Microbacterium sp. TaxID=191216 RepID=UPI0035CB7E2C